MKSDAHGALRDSRILLVGGSGWIGRAVMHVLSGYRCQVMSLNSTTSFAKRSTQIRRASAFEPSIAIFLAGVTPDRGADLGIKAYTHALDGVTATLEGVLGLPSLSQVCYVSSGVANVDDEFHDNPVLHRYRSAKMREERLVTSLTLEQEPLIVRVYSLSGPYVRRPRQFALYDFIQQSRTGSITVRSRRRVYRSYSCVLDVAKVMASTLAMRRGGIYSTGGYPIELADLANQIADVAPHPVHVVVQEPRTLTDVYCGDDAEWMHWCATSGVDPRDLRTQIIESHQWLEGRPRS